MRFQCINCSRVRVVPPHKFSRSCRCRACGCKLFPTASEFYRTFSNGILALSRAMGMAVIRINQCGISAEELAASIEKLARLHPERLINRQRTLINRNKNHARPERNL